LWIEWGGGDTVVVTNSFRYTNSLGNEVVSKAEAKMNADGEIFDFNFIE